MSKLDRIHDALGDVPGASVANILSWIEQYSPESASQLALAADLFSALSAPDNPATHAPSEVVAVDGLRNLELPADGQEGAQEVIGLDAAPSASIKAFALAADSDNGTSAFEKSAAFTFAESYVLANELQNPDTSSVGQRDLANAEQDLIILDDAAFARGGEKGGNGGGGRPGGGGNGDGGGSDPNVLSEYTSGGDSATSFNITINFIGTWTEQLQQAFIEAADLLSSIITDDIADVRFRGKLIDDVNIDAELQALDGSGGILGQAGPTSIRTNGFLPATAEMTFDSADANDFYSIGLWGEIVLHEMLHSIGFGTIWDFLNLVDNSDPSAPVFLGEYAKSEYGDGTAYVPVEEGGGAGTALSHWDDQTFTTEIMTGYLYTNGEPANVDIDLMNGYVSLDDGDASDLSNMTIASLEDIGYETVWEPDAPLIA